VTGRRTFLRAGAGAIAAALVAPERLRGSRIGEPVGHAHLHAPIRSGPQTQSGQSAQPDPSARSTSPAQSVTPVQSARPGDGGRLGDPTVAGRPQEPTGAYDNDARLQALEKRLRCGCGCTLDVYTCRTTDFTCTYSPELHREIVALWEAGQREDAIVNAFVAKYGEEVLMAPEPEGFNLAGYLVPAAVVTGLGATLVWVLERRTRLAARHAGAAAGGEAPAHEEAPAHGRATAPVGAREPARAASTIPSFRPSAASPAPVTPPTADELRALERAIAEDDAAT
jgi:cytochrome c-type biogenesis protein CcmH